MASSDRERWNRRYRDPIRKLRKDPQKLLVDHAPPVQPGSRALELACGLGFDAMWLAEQGYTVDAIDISINALRKARAGMLERGITGVNFIVADLDHGALPVYVYDLVYGFRFLDRSLFAALRDRVRPGGIVIYETLNTRWVEIRPETRQSHMLAKGELITFFSDWDVLHFDESTRMSGIVARKPEA